MNSDSENSKPNSRSISPLSIHRELIGFERGQVHDIGGGILDSSLLKELNVKFLWQNGPFQKDRLLPASVLHDDNGLKLWAQMNRQPHYYQTNDEIQLLNQNCKEIAGYLATGFTILDLGCGDVRKITPLLDALEELEIPIQYFALDLSRPALEENMQKMRGKYTTVQCYGLWGSFDNALSWVKTYLPTSRKCFISLGSMFGNDYFQPAVRRLRLWKDLMGSQDLMLLGLDACHDKETVLRSYDDEAGYFRKFIRNGFNRSNEVLRSTWYRDEDWSIKGELVEEPAFMHQFVLTSIRPVKCEVLGVNFPEGQRIVCYEGFKYGPSTMQKQFEAVDLVKLDQWCSPSGRIYQYLVMRGAASVV